MTQPTKSGFQWSKSISQHFPLAKYLSNVLMAFQCYDVISFVAVFAAPIKFSCVPFVIEFVTFLGPQCSGHLILGCIKKM